MKYRKHKYVGQTCSSNRTRMVSFNFTAFDLWLVKHHHQSAQYLLSVTQLSALSLCNLVLLSNYRKYLYFICRFVPLRISRTDFFREKQRRSQSNVDAEAQLEASTCVAFENAAFDRER